MADNYLEKRAEELREGSRTHRRSTSRTAASLDSLLLRNRSCRGFDPATVVDESKLKGILSVNTRLASAGNRQRLRFRPLCSTTPEGAEAVRKVLGLVHFGAALPELHLPLPGTEPGAFIIVCATEECRMVDIDLGISLQAMSLKAVELGLNTLIICSFPKDELRQALGIPLPPIAVLAVGKSCEKTFLKPVRAGEDLAYYRRDGIHYVPKIRVEDLLV